MGAIQYQASGPIQFTTKGKQKSLPVSKFSFNGTDFQFDDDWKTANDIKDADTDDISKQLSVLVNQGFLSPVGKPSAPAMVISAAYAGTEGNRIEITFADVDPKAGTFKATVTQNINYTKLKLADLAGALGTDAKSGPQGGLVFLSSAAPAFPKDDKYHGDNSDPAKVTVSAATGGGSAFDLTARRGGAEGPNITVTVKKVADDAFDLNTQWSKTVEGLKTDTIEKAFSYAIKVAPPVKNGKIALPTEGTITLAGGADAVASTPASIVVMSAS